MILAQPEDVKKMIWLMKQTFIKGHVYKGFTKTPYPINANEEYDYNNLVCDLGMNDIWMPLDSKPIKLLELDANSRNYLTYWYSVLTPVGSGYIGLHLGGARNWNPTLEEVLKRRIC